MNIIVAYGLTEDKTEHIATFDGLAFINDEKLEKLDKYDYVRIYGKPGLTMELAVIYINDIRKIIQDEYRRLYGEVEQITIF